jgi:hypothetical protein
MSKIDLRRVIGASRELHAELTRHSDEYEHLGEFRERSVAKVITAAQSLGLALQGRESVFDAIPETEPNSGVSVHVGGELDVAIALGVIRNVLPKLLRCIGYRGLTNGTDLADARAAEKYALETGIPSVAGVKMGPEQGQSELDALARAADRLDQFSKASAHPDAKPETPPADGNGTRRKRSAKGPGRPSSVPKAIRRAIEAEYDDGQTDRYKIAADVRAKLKLNAPVMIDVVEKVRVARAMRISRGKA